MPTILSWRLDIWKIFAPLIMAPTTIVRSSEKTNIFHSTPQTDFTVINRTLFSIILVCSSEVGFHNCACSHQIPHAELDRLCVASET
jgi:hypothetical protein